MLFNVYRWRWLLLRTAGPLAHRGLRHVPMGAKFRKIDGGYQPRRWFRWAVIVAAAYEAMRRPSKDLDYLAAADIGDKTKP